MYTYSTVNAMTAECSIIESEKYVSKRQGNEPVNKSTNRNNHAHKVGVVL